MTPLRERRRRPAAFRRRQVVVRHRGPNPFLVALRLLAAAALLFGVPLASAHWFLTSPRFELRRIESAVEQRVPAAWIAEALDPLRGRHLFLLSLADVERRVGRHPWVAAARIRKVLPDALRVEVIERRPAALLLREEAHYAVDAGGRVIDVADAELMQAGLLLVLGEKTERGDVAAALTAAERLESEAPRWLVGLLEIEVVGVGEYRIRAKGLDFPVLLSDSRLEAGARALDQLLPRILTAYPDLRRVDLRFAHQVVIETLEA